MRYEYLDEQSLLIKKYKDVGGEWILMIPTSVFLGFLCYRIFTSQFFPSVEGVFYIALLGFIFCYLNYNWIREVRSRRNFLIEKLSDGVHVNRKRISSSIMKLELQAKELYSMSKFSVTPRYEIILKSSFNKICLARNIHKVEAVCMVKEVGRFLSIEAKWRDSWI